MDKQQKMKIALSMLVLVMAFVWGPMIMGGGSKKKGKSTGNMSSTAILKESGSDLIALARLSERKKARTSYEDWGRSPFTLSQNPKASVLEGILWDVQDPKAMINGYILGIGEKVGAGVITDIQPASVTIKTGTAEKIYQLGQ